MRYQVMHNTLNTKRKSCCDSFIAFSDYTTFETKSSWQITIALTLFGLILSYLILSYLISSHLISSHLISCHLILSYHMSSHVISSHFISSHLISSHFISSHLISSHFISSHLISSHSLFYTIHSKFYQSSIKIVYVRSPTYEINLFWKKCNVSRLHRFLVRSLAVLNDLYQTFVLSTVLKHK